MPDSPEKFIIFYFAVRFSLNQIDIKKVTLRLSIIFMHTSTFILNAFMYFSRNINVLASLH